MNYNDIISNVEVFGIERAFKASKYPMSTDISSLNGEITDRIKTLATTDKGEGHDNFLLGIIVQFDLTFTVKAWTEEERYHFIDIISSQSTMHRITKFDLRNQYNEYVDPRIIEVMEEKVAQHNKLLAELAQTPTDDEYNRERLKNLITQKYLEILYSNPAGFMLTARLTTNYRCLKNIWRQRRNHRLPEWRAFCKWIETLPYAKELICYEEKE